MKGENSMKKKWPILALVVLLCVTVLCGIPAYAAEVRASEQINLTKATLTKTSDGNLSTYFSVRATRKMNVIGASSVAIQRNTANGWITEYTFTPSNTPSIQAENKYQYSTVLTYSPLFSEQEYRAVVMIYVKDATGASTQQLTSQTIVT